MFVVAVYAPPEVRYERISTRVMPKDDTVLRHRPFTKKEARVRDYAEIENLEKGGPIAMADYTIMNDRGIATLYKQIESIYENIEKG